MADNIDRTHVYNVMDWLEAEQNDMLIAMANFAKDNGINYQNKLIFAGQDIDWFMGLSCYIQLSLLGCSGYIRIADTLKDPIGNADFMSENVWVFPMSKIQPTRKEVCLVNQGELENGRKENG